MALLLHHSGCAPVRRTGRRRRRTSCRTNITRSFWSCRSGPRADRRRLSPMDSARIAAAKFSSLPVPSKRTTGACASARVPGSGRPPRGARSARSSTSSSVEPGRLPGRPVHRRAPGGRSRAGLFRTVKTRGDRVVRSPTSRAVPRKPLVAEDDRRRGTGMARNQDEARAFHDRTSRTRAYSGTVKPG
jgi:hypothetical protein